MEKVPTTEKEILIKLLDYMIGLVDLNDVVETKIKAVKEGKYEDAAILRDKENQLRASIPRIADIKELRNKL